MKRLLPVVIALTLGSLPTSTAATEQFEEFLVYNGKRAEILHCPLESYFSEKNPRPEFPVTSTALWRGYLGLWKIENKKLYLVSLHEADYEGEDLLGKEMSLKRVFPDATAPIHAKWFSGVLRVPQGEGLVHTHNRYAAIHEKDVYITVKKGHVVAERMVDNRREGATRSHEDLQWVTLADAPLDDDGKWLDARLIGTPTFAEIRNSGKQFVTRGIFFEARDAITNKTFGPSSLWIPNTPTTRWRQFVLDEIPEIPKGAHDAHVELKARYKKVGEEYSLHVESIRILKPGETIHHSGFKPPEKATQPADKRG